MKIRREASRTGDVVQTWADIRKAQRSFRLYTQSGFEQGHIRDRKVGEGK